MEEFESKYAGDDACCPFCGGDDIEFDLILFSYFGDGFTQEVKCAGCNKKWINIYPAKLGSQQFIDNGKHLTIVKPREDGVAVVHNNAMG